MANMWFAVPSPIAIIDPSSGDPALNDSGGLEIVSFDTFIKKLMFNPLWIDSYKNICAADSISKMVFSKKPGEVVSLSEFEWALLGSAIQKPRQQLIGPLGPVLHTGFGYHPSVTPQLLPFMYAVLSAVKEKNAEHIVEEAVLD